MGSKSAATSPTGSSHGTPTHQNKPQTLDPFADLGTLGIHITNEDTYFWLQILKSKSLVLK